MKSQNDIQSATARESRRRRREDIGTQIEALGSQPADVLVRSLSQTIRTKARQSKALSPRLFLEFATHIYAALSLDYLYLQVHKIVTSGAEASCFHIQGQPGLIQARRGNAIQQVEPTSTLDLRASEFGFELSGRREPPPMRLVVGRAIPLTDLDITRLDLLTSLLGMVVSGRLDRRYVTRVDQSNQKAVRMESEGRYFGSVVAELLGGLTRALAARAGVYATQAGSRYAIEYCSARGFARKRGQVVSPSPILDTPEAFLQELSHGRVFIWSSSEDVLGHFKPLINDLQNAVHVLLVIPVVELGCVIGWFAFAFEENDPVPSAALVRDLHPAGIKSTRYLLQRRFPMIVVQPIYKGRETRITDGQCAVLMPFTESWSDRIWTKVLAPTITAAGFTPIRADDLYGRDVMEDIWSMILSAEVVVADITGRNANVFYELGLAHAVGKEVLLITQDVNDIPFDLNRYRHIIYEDNVDGCDHLSKQLGKTLKR